MNKLILVLMVLGTIAVMVGCGSGSSNSSNSGPTIATTPCDQPGCAIAPWAYGTGFSPYQYGYDTAGYCGCGNGFYPAINGANLGCVSTSYLPTTVIYANFQAALAFNYGIYGYTQGGAPSSYWSGPTRANPYALGQTYGTCYNNAATTCNLAQGTTSNPSCGTGICVGVSGNYSSAVNGWGVCTY